MHVLDDLKARGLVEQITDEAGIRELLSQGSQPIYVGFDPTATSLHAGSLLPIMALARLQRAGHTPIVLVGGATGYIGDPSGKDAERSLQTPEVIQRNVDGIREQLARFVSFEGDNAAIMVNNYDWTSKMSYIDWLREVGKYFSVNYMIAKESVRRRIEERDQGISYTEFSYMLMQANDFLELFKTYGCRIQAGGNDQWGNITAGIDLVHKKEAAQVYGVTFPLLMTASGEKFGKSAGNAVWLDADMTSPYAFYQYWMQADDRDVERYLKLFTFLAVDEIDALVAEHAEAPHRRKAQKVLAEELTRSVHGDEGLRIAMTATEVLFGSEISGLDDKALGEIFADVPSKELPVSTLDAGVALPDLLADVGAQPSKGKARKLVKQGGAYINNRRINDMDYTVTRDDLASETTIVLRTGKKSFFLVRFV